LEEWTRAIAADHAADHLLVLPTGAVEQHGPHLPTGTDTFCVEHIARSAAGAVAARIPILVAPTLPYGSSHHHLPFGATMSLRTDTYLRVLMDLLESLVGANFWRVFVLNGHGGNHELVQLAVRDLALTTGTEAHLAAGSWWTIANDRLMRDGAPERGRFPGHAGAFESSLLLALRPELVREPRPGRTYGPGLDPRPFAASYRVEEQGFWSSFDGFTDSPETGRAEHGQAYLASAIAAVSEAFLEFHAGTGGRISA
jgi:creatinine amidohydrolase